MDEYTGLWTRQASVKLLVSSILLKYGNYLTWHHCNETILHDDCVDGTLTKDVLLPYVNDHVREIVGFDKWKYIIDEAKEVNPDDKIKYELYNTMNKNVTDVENKFDRIFSFFVAEVAVPNKVLLRNYHKMLKRSGQIFMVIAVNTPVERSIHIQVKRKKWAPYLKNRKIYENYTDNPIDYFQNLLGETGFKAEYCDLVKLPLILETFSDLIKLLWPMYGTFWNCIPKHLKEDFLKENAQLSEEMMSYECKPDKYRMIVDTLICIASKV